LKKETDPPKKRTYPGLYEKIVPFSISLIALFVLLLIAVSLFILLRDLI